MTPFKLKVGGDIAFERAQRFLFACGYTWNSGDTRVKWATGYRYLEVTPVREGTSSHTNDKVLRYSSSSINLPVVVWPWLEELYESP